MNAIIKMVPYGAYELKKVYQRYFSYALAIAICLHLIVIGSYYGALKIAEREERAVSVRILKYADLGPPPSLSDAQQAAPPPEVKVSAPVAQPTVGVPVPVPDAKAQPEQTIATQQEMGKLTSALGTGSSSDSIVVQRLPERVQIEIPKSKEEEPGINEFVSVQELPVIIKKPKPEYPEIARKAGVEGTVIVRMLVDKEGRVKKVVVQQSAGAGGLDEAAVEAAKRYVFKPAINANQPVSVWVSIPFRFRLKDAAK